MKQTIKAFERIETSLDHHHHPTINASAPEDPSACMVDKLQDEHKTISSYLRDKEILEMRGEKREQPTSHIPHASHVSTDPKFTSHRTYRQTMLSLLPRQVECSLPGIIHCSRHHQSQHLPSHSIKRVAYQVVEENICSLDQGVAWLMNLSQLEQLDIGPMVQPDDAAAAAAFDEDDDDDMSLLFARPVSWEWLQKLNALLKKNPWPRLIDFRLQCYCPPLETHVLTLPPDFDINEGNLPAPEDVELTSRILPTVPIPYLLECLRHLPFSLRELCFGIGLSDDAMAQVFDLIRRGT